MDFNFSEEQNKLKQLVQKFSKEVLAPNYARWDKEDIFPRDVLYKMVELGLLGLRVSEEYGGSKQDFVTTGIILEELAKGDFNFSNFLISSGLIGEIIEAHASEDIKREWLPKMASGEKLIGLALTEPHAGSDATAIQTQAIKEHGEYVINGSKSGISLATYADAFVLFAKTNIQEKAKGITAFLMPSDLPGIEKSRFEDMGERMIGRGMLYLDGVRIPESFRIGEEGKGFYQVMAGFDYSRVLIALACIGAARVTLDETIQYVKERSAFGKPLAKFEGVSFEIAEMETYLEMFRWMSYHALWLREQNLPHTKEAAMCKWLIPKTCVEIIHQCLLLHGHYGYTKEYPVEQRMRDVMGLEIGDGTAQTQKIIISREVLGREFLPY